MQIVRPQQRTAAAGPDSVGTSAPAPTESPPTGSDRLVVSVIAGLPLVHEGVRELLKGSSYEVKAEARFAGGAIALLDPTIVDPRVSLATAVGALGRRFQHVVLFPMVVSPDDRLRANSVGASGVISQTAPGFELRHGLDAVVAGRTAVVPTNPRLFEAD